MVIAARAQYDKELRAMRKKNANSTDAVNALKEKHAKLLNESVVALHRARNEGKAASSTSPSAAPSNTHSAVPPDMTSVIGTAVNNAVSKALVVFTNHVKEKRPLAIADGENEMKELKKSRKAFDAAKETVVEALTRSPTPEIKQEVIKQILKRNDQVTLQSWKDELAKMVDNEAVIDSAAEMFLNSPDQYGEACRVMSKNPKVQCACAEELVSLWFERNFSNGIPAPVIEELAIKPRIREACADALMKEWELSKVPKAIKRIVVQKYLDALESEDDVPDDLRCAVVNALAIKFPNMSKASDNSSEE